MESGNRLLKLNGSYNSSYDCTIYDIDFVFLDEDDIEPIIDMQDYIFYDNISSGMGNNIN